MLDDIQKAFGKQGYVTDHETDITLQLVLALAKPLLIEGPAGVGKTAIAKVLADTLDTSFIRLQCYEGLDVNTSLYEWNYAKQMLHIQLTEHEHTSVRAKEQDIFSRDFLLQRPLLNALLATEQSPVLLIDEIDRADEAFEAFLLEILGEFQVTIPELGTITAEHPPYVILTSNRSRELSDALRRRCLYQWLDYPDISKEMAILQMTLPEVDQQLAEQLVTLITHIRELPLNKVPGVAESIDWAHVLTALYDGRLTTYTLQDTMACLIKDRDDRDILVDRLQTDNWLKKVGMHG